MADNYPVPPPPPPPQSQKPVPPPPPRSGNPRPRPPVPPATLWQPMAEKRLTRAVCRQPAPSCRGRRAGMPPMPGMMGMPGSGPLAARTTHSGNGKTFSGTGNRQNSLELQLAEIGKQLKEEHEKVILQNLKAKEEEALSSRVEQQIREMQEKLRRDKHEQEILNPAARRKTSSKTLNGGWRKNANPGCPPSKISSRNAN